MTRRPGEPIADTSDAIQSHSLFNPAKPVAGAVPLPFLCVLQWLDLGFIPGFTRIFANCSWFWTVI